jgi:carbonic anhydrase/acetyltransferase-like protein (isoleucine patch superfamily)
VKKFELTSEFVTNISGTKLFRIKALVEFGDVEAGELGGYIEKEENLDHDGDAWVYGNARVYGDAQVYGDARVCGDARVYGDAQVYGNALVCGDAWVCGDARVYGDAQVYGDARVCGDARVYGDAQVYGNADYAYAHGFGSVNRTTTFFRLKNGNVGVVCGCFHGTLQEFRDKIRETHGETKKAQEYLMLADLMDFRFKN